MLTRQRSLPFVTKQTNGYWLSVGICRVEFDHNVETIVGDFSFNFFALRNTHVFGIEKNAPLQNFTNAHATNEI